MAQLGADPQAVIDELSMQCAQLTRDNAILRVQVGSLSLQLQELESKVDPVGERQEGAE